MGEAEDEEPLVVDIHAVESWLSAKNAHSVDHGYYWSAPKSYLGNQIAAYKGLLTVVIRFNSPTLNSLYGVAGRDPHGRYSSNSLVVKSQLDNMWLNEPDIVLEVIV